MTCWCVPLTSCLLLLSGGCTLWLRENVLCTEVQTDNKQQAALLWINTQARPNQPLRMSDRSLLHSRFRYIVFSLCNWAANAQKLRLLHSFSSFTLIAESFGLFAALFPVLPHFFCCLSHCFSHCGFLLDTGSRAQLSADAGQRRPSQKEKYVSPSDHPSPFVTSHPKPHNAWDWMKVWAAWLRYPRVDNLQGISRFDHPINRRFSAWKRVTDFQPLFMPWDVFSSSFPILTCN